MATAQHKLFIITTILFVLANLSQAWTNTAFIPHTPSVRRGRTILLAKTSSSTPSASALYYQNGNDYEQESLSYTVNDELDTEVRLQIALQAARDADRRYGLCTPASLRAWQIVDDIYSSSSASRKVEDSVKKCLGSEKSVWSEFAWIEPGKHEGGDILWCTLYNCHMYYILMYYIRPVFTDLPWLQATYRGGFLRLPLLSTLGNWNWILNYYQAETLSVFVSYFGLLASIIFHLIYIDASYAAF